jgi:hypothetical protein
MTAVGWASAHHSLFVAWTQSTILAATINMLQESSSFLKKRTKRLLFLRSRPIAGPILKSWGLGRGCGEETKVFCFFSSEKKTLPYFPNVVPLNSAGEFA